MSRNFIATVLTVAVTITGISAAPTRAADAQDVAKVLGAAATLYILGTAISNAQGRADKHGVKTHEVHGNDHRHRIYQDRTWDRTRADGHRGNGHAQRLDHAKKPIARERDRNRHRVLPASCLRRVEGRKGKARQVFGRNCLKNRADLRRLPAVCETGFRARNGNRRIGYRPNCMRNQGFVVAWNR